MSSLDVFFLLPAKGKFLSHFDINDNLKLQADLVWRQLEGLAPLMLLAMAVIGAGVAYYYYQPYNEQPGRHYRVSHWAVAGVIASVLAFVVTLVVEYFGIKTNPRTGCASLYWVAALNNAIYCIGVYLFTSWVWCQWLPTNAYKVFG